MYPTSIEVRNGRLYDPKREECFGPEFRTDTEGQGFLAWVAGKQRRVELSGELGDPVETWDNSRLNDVFRDYYSGWTDSRGFVRDIPLRELADGNLSAVPEPIVPAPKPRSRWLAWLDRGK